MRIVILFFFILVAGSAGCKKKSSIPGNVLAQQKMQAVLWDMIRADHFINNYMVIKDSSLNKRVAGFKMYNRILGIHKISEEDFKKSFSFYRSNPELMWPIMDSISKMSDEAPTQQIKPVPLEDSLIQTGPSTDTISPRKMKPVSLD